jgi:threonine dehydratase
MESNVMKNIELPDFEDIRKAHDRIKAYIHRTPVVTCQALNRMCQTEIYFKCENLQKVGAFKIRGAANAVMSLSDGQAQHGVATHSSGNHAAALAQAARWRGIKSFVVMPEDTNRIKIEAVRGYGAEITFCQPTAQAREEVLQEVVKATGAVFIPSYNHAHIIAGQGTAALELLEEIPQLDAVMAPVGGGGLLSGTAIAAAHLLPGAGIYGAEPENADDARRSFHAGKLIPVKNPNTIADGLRTSLGHLTFAIICRYVTDIISVSEANIVFAMRHIWERMKLIVEPSAAVPVAALLSRRTEVAGKRIGIILSGGNVDVKSLPF